MADDLAAWLKGCPIIDLTGGLPGAAEHPANGPGTPGDVLTAMNSDTKWIIGTVVVLAGLLSAQIAGVHARIDDVHARIDDVHARIDDVHADLTARMDRLDARMDRIETRLDGFDERLRNVEVAFGKVDQRLLTLERVILPPPAPGQ